VVGQALRARVRAAGRHARPGQQLSRRSRPLTVAVQAGAARVYAIEASDMVRHAQKLFDANPVLGAKISLLHGKLEAIDVPEKADILISEPMGTLLVNERMLETYVYARRHMLKPGGKMFPGAGQMYVAAFSDAVLFNEQLGMAAFWANEAFYGVNLRALHADAQAVRSARARRVLACNGRSFCVSAQLAYFRRACVTARWPAPALWAALAKDRPASLPPIIRPFCRASATRSSSTHSIRASCSRRGRRTRSTSARSKRRSCTISASHSASSARALPRCTASRAGSTCCFPARPSRCAHDPEA
jgi:hypothetical protein